MTNYDAFAKTFSNSRKNMYWPEIDVILSDCKKNHSKSFLDVGCGNGRFLSLLRKYFGDSTTYLGIDASPGMIEEAKKLYRDEEFLVSAMPNFENLEKSKYDSIVLLASFHHLKTKDERVLCLENLKDFLSPSGHIYMTNWNLLDQEKYQKDHRGNGDFDIKIGEFTRYYHGFSLQELRELFEETGWKIKENEIFEGRRNIITVLALT